MRPGSHEQPGGAWRPCIAEHSQPAPQEDDDLADEVRGLLKVFGIRLPKIVQHGILNDIVRPLIEMDEGLTHALVPLLDARLILCQHFFRLWTGGSITLLLRAKSACGS